MKFKTLEKYLLEKGYERLFDEDYVYFKKKLMVEMGIAEWIYDIEIVLSFEESIGDDSNVLIQWIAFCDLDICLKKDILNMIDIVKKVETDLRDFGAVFSEDYEFF